MFKSKSRDLEYFFENLSMMVQSGAGMTTSFQTLKRNVRDKKVRESIDAVEKRLQAGQKLSEALKEEKVIPERFANIIAIGETSGSLPIMLESIVNRRRKESEFKSKMLTAMLYPLVVLMIVGGVMIFAGSFILPKFVPFLESFETELAWYSLAVLKFGKLMTTWGIVFVPAFLATIAGIVHFLFFRRKSKHIGETFLLKTPGLQEVFMSIEMSRFGFVLSTLLHAGVPILVALNSLKDSTGSVLYKQMYQHAIDRLQQGDSLSKSLISFDKTDLLMPSAVVGLIMSAEVSGKLPDVLEMVSNRYGGKVDLASRRVAVAIEPILLITLGVVVGLFAFSVIQPIYSIYVGV